MHAPTSAAAPACRKSAPFTLVLQSQSYSPASSLETRRWPRTWGWTRGGGKLWSSTHRWRRGVALDHGSNRSRALSLLVGGAPRVFTVRTCTTGVTLIEKEYFVPHAST
ncbi:hypothetical protein MSAN_01752200 [Mycena sanguinolenta]|uniref:Uncharacterized protein n=1 Tax=Mycena sanguinolenta TaxID=230812 RepID=A0A8H6XWS9_9AGAR|nr:hypothetical protein MSAN_01752200 [Mycena sanguinolenta]